jgi:hypothetical protein
VGCRLQARTVGSNPLPIPAGLRGGCPSSVRHWRVRRMDPALSSQQQGQRPGRRAILRAIRRPGDLGEDAPLLDRAMAETSLTAPSGRPSWRIPRQVTRWR